MPRLIPSLLTAAAAASILAPASAADDPAPLKFAWPVPSKATVTEKIWKGVRTATTRYIVTVERSGTGDDLRAHLSDFTFIDMDGKPPTDPAVAPALAEAEALAKLTPDLLIAPDGTVKDVLGLDALIEAQIVGLESHATEEMKPHLPEIRAKMTSPAERERKKRISTNWWRTWVAEWVGLSLAEGKVVEGKRTVRDVDETERDAPAVFRLVPAPDDKGLMQVAREAALDGDATKASLEQWVATLARQTGKTPPDGFFTGLRLTSRAAVTVDLATLRPRRALSEESCVVHRKGHEDLMLRGNLERHEYEFVWDAQPGAGK